MPGQLHTCYPAGASSPPRSHLASQRADTELIPEAIVARAIRTESAGTMSSREESARAIGTGPNRRIFTKKLGSQETPCWSKGDSKSRSRITNRRFRRTAGHAGASDRTACGGTKGSNPLCSSAESATNLVAAGGVARGWDSEFESALLLRRVLCEPDFVSGCFFNRDPLPKQHNALITDAEFDHGGFRSAPIRTPANLTFPSNVNAFALIYGGVPIGCRNTAKRCS